MTEYNYKDIKVKPDTKELLDENKPEGVTFDFYIKSLVLAEKERTESLTS